METTYSSTLKIHKLSKAQYDGITTKDATALYLTPEQPLVITINNGTTEGTNKFTYDGSESKTVNISTSSGDTKVTQAATITTDGNYPVILGYNTGTTSVTNSVNKASTLVFNPSTGSLCVGNPSIISGTYTNATTGKLYVNGNIYAGGGTDNYGIYPSRANYSEVGSSSLYWYKMYTASIYANSIYVGGCGSQTSTTLANYVDGRIDTKIAGLTTTDEKVKITTRTASTQTKCYVLGVNSSNYSTSTAHSAVYIDTGIYIDSTAGRLTAASFYATSDKRLKENLVAYSPEKSILDLPVYKYNYISDEKKAEQIGCLAQDLREICPEIVQADEDNGYLTINESKIVYLLLDEVKKLKAEVEELKTKA